MYIYLFNWLHWVLVVAHGIFLAARGLFVAARGLLSSCAVQALERVGSVVAVRGRSGCDAWTLEHVSSRTRGFCRCLPCDM